MARILFLGTGEAFDHSVPNTSILLESTVNILFDCGYSIPHRLWSVNTGSEFLEAIYLSHQHGDHAMGVIPIWIRALEDGRLKPLKIIVPDGVGLEISRLIEVTYPGLYSKYGESIELIELTSGSSFGLHDIKLEVGETDHPAKNHAVRVTLPNGYRFVYSGDGHPTPKTQQLYAGCDLLIHEAFFYDRERRGHSAMQSVVLMAKELGVKKVALVHISRYIREMAGNLLEKLAPAMEVIIPKPGDFIEI